MVVTASIMEGSTVVKASTAIGTLLVTAALVAGSAAAAASPVADTVPPSPPRNPCAVVTDGKAGFVLRWSPSTDNVDSPDQITYLVWQPASHNGGQPIGVVVGKTELSFVTVGWQDLVINAVDRAGNQSEFVWPVVRCG